MSSNLSALDRDAVHVERCDDAHVCATWRNIAIVVWRTETRSQDIRAVGEVLASLVGLHPQGVGLMQVVEATATSLDSEARTTLADLLRAGRHTIKCSTVIFEMDGFRAAAVRAIVTGLAMLSRPGFPHHVFADVAQAAKWQVSHMAPPSQQAFMTTALMTAVLHTRKQGPLNRSGGRRVP